LHFTLDSKSNFLLSRQQFFLVILFRLVIEVVFFLLPILVLIPVVIGIVIHTRLGRIDEPSGVIVHHLVVGIAPLHFQFR
jgi:uncharacterized membrane protein YhaH (DUF805 family)